MFGFNEIYEEVAFKEFRQEESAYSRWKGIIFNSKAMKKLKLIADGIIRF